MRFKRALLASSALALFAGVQEAQAGMYLSVLGGANFHQNQSGVATSENSTLVVHTDTDTGFVIGAAIGTGLDKWVKGLRTEVEVSYRRNDVGGHFSFTDGGEGSTTGPIDANISNFAVLANIWYDIDIGSKVVPYIGGGAGWDRVHINGALLTSDGSDIFEGVDRTHSGFAYQLGAGFNYPVADGVTLGVGYRFFRGPDVHLDEIFSGKFDDNLSINLKNENHSAMVNLTIDIN